MPFGETMLQPNLTPNSNKLTDKRMQRRNSLSPAISPLGTPVNSPPSSPLGICRPRRLSISEPVGHRMDRLMEAGNATVLVIGKDANSAPAATISALLELVGYKGNMRHRMS